MSARDLDELLELARPAEPRDEAFVRAVMSGIVPGSAVPGIRALAAAAAVVLAASLGAALRSPEPVTPERAASPPGAERSTAGSGDAGAAPSGSAGPAAPTLRTEQTERSGSLEWGRPTGTSAYAVDHRTGLRLEAAVERAEVDAGVPQRVTLTLRNTGDRALSIAARGGCVLAIGVFDASGASDPQPRRCAAVRDRPHESAAFVLAPGAERVADATVVLAPGSWDLVGMCDCAYGPPPAGAAPAELVGPLGGLGGSTPPVLPPAVGAGEAGGGGLATPPIVVRAS